MRSRPASVFPRRSRGLNDDSDIARHLRFLGVVEVAGPARPIEIERNGARREALPEIVPKIIRRAGRNGLRLVEIDEPLERAHAGVRIESGHAFRIEIFAAFSHQHLIETAVDRLLLAGEFGAVEVRRIGEEDRLVFHLLPGGGGREIVTIFLLERLLLGLVRVVALEVIEGGNVELRPGQHLELAVDGRGLDDAWNVFVELLLRDQLVEIGVEARILRRERGVVPADAPFDVIGGDIGLELLVDVEAVLLGENVDLGAGQFLPFADAGVERFVLVAADDLRVDHHAGERSGLIGGRCETGRHDQRRRGDRQGCALHGFPPLGSWRFSGRSTGAE